MLLHPVGEAEGIVKFKALEDIQTTAWDDFPVVIGHNSRNQSVQPNKLKKICLSKAQDFLLSSIASIISRHRSAELNP